MRGGEKDEVELVRNAQGAPHASCTCGPGAPGSLALNTPATASAIDCRPDYAGPYWIGKHDKYQHPYRHDNRLIIKRSPRGSLLTVPQEGSSFLGGGNFASRPASYRSSPCFRRFPLLNNAHPKSFSLRHEVFCSPISDT